MVNFKFSLSKTTFFAKNVTRIFKNLQALALQPAV